MLTVKANYEGQQGSHQSQASAGIHAALTDILIIV